MYHHVKEPSRENWLVSSKKPLLLPASPLMMSHSWWRDFKIRERIQWCLFLCNHMDMLFLSLGEKEKRENEKRENRIRRPKTCPSAKKRRCRKVTWFSSEIPSILKISDLGLIHTVSVPANCREPLIACWWRLPTATICILWHAVDMHHKGIWAHWVKCVNT